MMRAWSGQHSGYSYANIFRMYEYSLIYEETKGCFWTMFLQGWIRAISCTPIFKWRELALVSGCTGKFWEISVVHQFRSDQPYPARLVVIVCLSHCKHFQLRVISISDILLSKWLSMCLIWKCKMSDIEKCVTCELEWWKIRPIESIILRCDGSSKTHNNSSKTTTAKWDGWVYCKFFFSLMKIYHTQFTIF